jgi:hypothetical protein
MLENQALMRVFACFGMCRYERMPAVLTTSDAPKVVKKSSKSGKKTRTEAKVKRLHQTGKPFDGAFSYAEEGT